MAFSDPIFAEGNWRPFGTWGTVAEFNGRAVRCGVSARPWSRPLILIIQNSSSSINLSSDGKMIREFDFDSKEKQVEFTDNHVLDAVLSR